MTKLVSNASCVRCIPPSSFGWFWGRFVAAPLFDQATTSPWWLHIEQAPFIATLEIALARKAARTCSKGNKGAVQETFSIFRNKLTFRKKLKMKISIFQVPAKDLSSLVFDNPWKGIKCRKKLEQGTNTFWSSSSTRYQDIMAVSPFDNRAVLLRRILRFCQSWEKPCIWWGRLWKQFSNLYNPYWRNYK